MNRAVLSQIKRTVKVVDEGSAVALGKKPPLPIKIHGTTNDRLSLERLCLTSVINTLANTTVDNYIEVGNQFARVPGDVKVKILQYMTVRRELGDFSTIAALTNFHFTVFSIPRNDKLTPAWATLFAPMCSSVEVLDLRGCKKLNLGSVLEIVRECGKNLVHLDISGIVPCDCAVLVKILQCTPNLKFLGVRDTDEDFSSLTNIAELCPRLRQLELSYNRGFSLSLVNPIIHGLPDLQMLDFSWCSGVYDDSVIAIAKTMGERLLALNLEMCCRGGDYVTEKSILELAKHCPNLEQLSVNALKFVTDEAICAIAQSCPNMKSLHVSGCEVSDVGVNAIATHCKNLELLSIVGLREITDESVQKVLKNCENLQLIDMANCILITAETKEKAGSKLFHTHPETNSPYIPFRVARQGIIV